MEGDLVEEIDKALAGVPDPTAPLPVEEPSELAELFVKVARRRRRLAGEENALKSMLAKMQDPILKHMREGKWPRSAEVAGANLHRKQTLYASPVEVEINGETIHDHDALTRVLEQLHQEQPNENWASLLPSKVNSQSLTGVFNEYLKNHDFEDSEKLLPLDERLVIAGCPRELLDVVKLTEKETVNANQL